MRVPDSCSRKDKGRSATDNAGQHAGEHGIALLTSMMILLFLTLAGAALMTSTRVDVQVATNYRTGVQSLFLAEAGIEAGRQTLRLSGNTPGENLVIAAGADGVLEESRDLDTLLASDDLPLLPVATGQRTAGQIMTDTAGDAAGLYHVWLRNDVTDGETATADSNQVVTLVSRARVGDAVRTIEAVVRRTELPDIPAALTLNGPVGTFNGANSNIFHVNGFDQCGGGENHSAIGVISDADDTFVTDAIPSNRWSNYTGESGEEPNVTDISGDLTGTDYNSVDGLESIVEGMEQTATTVYDPPFGGSTAISDIGSSTDPEIVVVNGDMTFGPGDGYGVLVVRGALTLSGNFNWTGIILVIGQGEIYWNGGGNGNISGGILLAKTRDTRTADNILGPVLATRGEVIADFNGGGGNGVSFDSCSLTDAEEGFPYVPIAWTEY